MATKNPTTLANSRAKSAASIASRTKAPVTTPKPEVKLDLTRKPSTPFERRDLAPVNPPMAEPSKFNPDIGQLTPDERIKNKAFEPIQRLEDKTTELFGAKPMTPKSLDEWEKMKANDLKKSQEETLRLKEEEAQQARQSDLYGLSDLKKSQKTGMENLTAAYGTDREGGQSVGNEMLPEDYKRRTQGRITLAEQQIELAEKNRSKILRDLKDAQENDQKALAQQLLGQLDLAEQEIAKYDERVANIEATRASTDRIRQETTLSNLEAMGTAVANLTLPELQRMGESAGFTMPQMLAFQKASELRAKASETKDMAEAERMVLMADQLENEINWQVEDRPLEVRAKEAEVRIKEAEANGIILDPREKLKYTQEMAEYMDSVGQGEVYLPTGTKYPVTPTGTGISVGVKDGDPTGWCGAFVNDVLGERIIGDSYEQKLSLINSQMPVVGAVGVMASPGDYAKNGHVVIVEKINSDGTLSIVESNGLNPMKAGRRNIPVTSFDGFIIPSSSKAVNTPGTRGVDSASIAILNQKARGTGEKKYTAQEKALLNQIESTFANPNSDLLEMLPLTAGGKEPGATEKNSIASYTKVLNGMSQLEKTIASTNPGGVFDAIKETVQSRLPYQEKSQAIKAQITALIPQIARGVFGEVGVLTDTDIERYTQLLPTLTTTKAIQQSLLDLMYTSLYNGIEADLDSMARAKVDVSRFTGQVENMRESRARLYGETKKANYTFDVNSPEAKQLNNVLTQKDIELTYDQLQEYLDEGYSVQDVIEYFNKK